MVEEILALEDLLADVAVLRVASADDEPRAAALDSIHHRIDAVRRGLAAALTVPEDCELERLRHLGDL